MTAGCDCAVCVKERKHMDAIEAMAQGLSGAADDFTAKGMHPGDIANAFSVVLAMVCKANGIGKATAKALYGMTVDSVYLLDDMNLAAERAAKKGH